MRDSSSKSTFKRLGRFNARRAWWVIGAWALLLAAAVPLLLPIQSRLSQGGFDVPGSDSDRVHSAVTSDFKGDYKLTDLLVVHSDSVAARDPEMQRVIASLRTALAGAPGVVAVSDPYADSRRMISADGHTLTAVVGLSDDEDAALRHAPALDATVVAAVEGHPITAHLTGEAPFHAAFYGTAQSDLEVAERYALPLSLLILLIAFGSMVAAGTPLLVAMLGLAVAFALISALAGLTLMSMFIENFAAMIGLGVGIDYSLFMVSRYRERLAAGRPVADAVAEAQATSGKAVFVSALTVVLALAGMALVNIPAFRSIGYGAMLAVAVAGIAANTLLPAMLALLGRRIDALSVPWLRPAADGAFWHRWSGQVMRRPWIWLAAAVAVMSILAIPARSLAIGHSGPAILAASAGPRVASEQLARAFGSGQPEPIEIVLAAPDLTGSGFATVWNLTHRLQADPEVARVDSIATLVPGADETLAKAALGDPARAPALKRLVARGGTETLLTVASRHDAQSAATEDLVKRLRGNLSGTLPAGATMLVGGDPATNTDIDSEVSSKLPIVIGMVLTLSFVLLLVFFRSPVLALKAILMNLLSVLAAYGILTFVFVQGHGLGLLGLSSSYRLEAYLPPFLFTVLFGLSMDYEVFLLARIREHYLQTGDNAEAVAWGLERTAGIITSAAAVMITVFGAFVLTTLVPVKEMGLGLAVAVVLDATVVRIVLVPATMRLMGRWNWWLPGWLDRILPNVDLEGAESGKVPALGPAGSHATT
jgi:RND superfamily putative drug exporter